jgi:hypothetical protein
MSDDIKKFISLANDITKVGALPQQTSLISDKYDKLYFILKQYISKLLVCVESTLFQHLKKNNTSINLQHNSCNRIINTLLSNHFNLTYHMIHLEKYDCTYFETMATITGEPKLHILLRIINIIVDFYHAIDRSKLRIDTPDNYLNDFADQFDLIFKAMKTTIYESFSKKIDMPFSEYVREYNPFHIKLPIDDYEEND